MKIIWYTSDYLQDLIELCEISQEDIHDFLINSGIIKLLIKDKTLIGALLYSLNTFECKINNVITKNQDFGKYLLNYLKKTTRRKLITTEISINNSTAMKLFQSAGFSIYNTTSDNYFLTYVKEKA